MPGGLALSAFIRYHRVYRSTAFKAKAQHDNEINHLCRWLRGWLYRQLHSFAIFGSSTWQVTDDLSLTAGLRWTRETNDIDLRRMAAPDATSVDFSDLDLHGSLGLLHTELPTAQADKQYKTDSVPLPFDIAWDARGDRRTFGVSATTRF